MGLVADNELHKARDDELKNKGYFKPKSQAKERPRNESEKLSQPSHASTPEDRSQPSKYFKLQPIPDSMF